MKRPSNNGINVYVLQNMPIETRSQKFVFGQGKSTGEVVVAVKSAIALLMYSPPLSSLRVLSFRLLWFSAKALKCLKASKTSDLAAMGVTKQYLE